MLDIYKTPAQRTHNARTIIVYSEHITRAKYRCEAIVSVKEHPQ
jgi:hypothetical protein